MENQTPTLETTSNASRTPTRAVRITSKQLKDGGTGKEIRAQFPAFTVQVRPLFEVAGEGKEQEIVNQLVADKVKELAQLRERGEWMAGATPYNPKDGKETAGWWQAAMEAVTTEQVWASLFAPTTRATAFGAARWEKWLKEVFLVALDAYYASQGMAVLSSAKRAATLAVMRQGRGMLEHNKLAFAKRMQSMLESSEERVLELMLSEESTTAFAWVTKAAETATLEELEI